MRDAAGQLEADGFCGPFDLDCRDLVEPMLDGVLARHDFTRKADTIASHHILGENRAAPLLLPNAHLDDESILTVGRDGAILDRLADVMGDEIHLRRSQFWRKPPGSRGVMWHQDVHRKLGLGYIGEYSAWVALEDSHIDNGCVWLLKGSHRAGVLEPTWAANPSFTLRFFAANEVIVPKALEGYEAVPMVLSKGQFFLFNQLCCHASGPNRTNTPRTGLAFRYIADASRAADGETSIRVR